MKKAGSVLFSDMVPRELPERLPLRFLRLWGETIFMTAFALLFPFVLGFAQGGMLSLFLVSASLMYRIRQLREENAYNIWILHKGGWSSNLLSSISILGIFMGLFTANLLFAWILNKLGSGQQWESFFQFLLKTQHLETGQPLAARFASFWAILFNNGIVLITTMLLVSVYRAYGLMLVISWNACIWAVVLFYLFRQALINTKLSTLSFLMYSGAAMLPHLILEALAYILAALAALFLSQAFSQYSFSDKRFRQVGRAAGTLLVLSFILILWAAFTETTLPPILLPR